MTAILQYGLSEIVINDPDEHQFIKQIIEEVANSGRAQWVPFMTTGDDGEEQTFELLIGPGVPVAIISNVPIEARL